MKKEKTFLKDPTFDSAVAATKKDGGVYITLQNGGYVKCVCSRERKKATIDFDLYTDTCNLDLSPETQERLLDYHRDYVRGPFIDSGYVGPIHCTFADSMVHFEVLPQDAEEWFQRMLTTFNNRARMIEVWPKRAAA